jgi:hypothetical protein
MGKYRKIELKGLEDLNDNKYSLARLALSENAKIAAEVNRELNGFKPMIEAAKEWKKENPEQLSKINAKGGKATSTICKEKGTGLFGLSDEKRKHWAKTNGDVGRANATKRRLKEETEFYDQLEDIHSTKDSNRIASSMGRSNAWGCRIIRKLGTKVKFTGKETIYKKKLN